MLIQFSLFLVNQLLTLADASDATTTALGRFEEVKEHAPDDVEDDIEDVWDVSNLRRSSERNPSVLERTKALCNYLSLPVQITVVKMQQWIESDIQAFANYLGLEAL